MRINKRKKSERERVVGMAARGTCICGCGCNKVCPCPSIPTHAIGQDQTYKYHYTRQYSSTSGSAGSY